MNKNTDTSPNQTLTSPTFENTNFIRNIIEKDLASGKVTQIHTRFPPEPNGYLHLGHAKAIFLSHGFAQQFKGLFNLRFDDTNPEKESEEFMTAIKRDLTWLGCDWDELHHASDYFEQLYDFAVALIKKGLAFVDSQSADDMRVSRGTLTEAGKESPFRNRDVEENLTLFADMRAGKHAEGEHVLRAKIDMASPNMNMRDPVIYRIKYSHHHRTGDSWCIYPMYDFTHCLSDMLEGITHSLCTLEFEDHRALYDWCLAALETEHRPQQIEFAKLQLEYTLFSKRNLLKLVTEGLVDGWDDPRMPTLAGWRRRGVPPTALRNFFNQIGTTKKDTVLELSYLEGFIRDELNQSATRRMAVIKPLKVTITNFPDEAETLSIANHPQDETLGKRDVIFSKTLYIEQDDFAEIPPSKWKRFKPESEIRLRGAYVIRCDEVVKDDAGNVIELKCSYDPDTLGKKPEGRKVKGVIHWVSATHSLDAEVRDYDRLFTHPAPIKLDDFTTAINPDSLILHRGAKLERALSDATLGDVFQFERLGYYTLDASAQSNQLIFNRTITLRDNWA